MMNAGHNTILSLLELANDGTPDALLSRHGGLFSEAGSHPTAQGEAGQDKNIRLLK